MEKYELLPDKKSAKQLKDPDHVMVEDQLWRVVQNHRSMGNPSRMLMLAYHTHKEPKSFKFHPVRDDEPFEVFSPIE